jgi:hypothetical protein
LDQKDTAYGLNCVGKDGSTIRAVVTRCAGLKAAIKCGVMELPKDCTTLEIVRMLDDQMVWRGTPDEAAAAASVA